MGDQHHGQVRWATLTVSSCGEVKRGDVFGTCKYHVGARRYVVWAEVREGDRVHVEKSNTLSDIDETTFKIITVLLCGPIWVSNGLFSLQAEQ